MMGKVQTVPDLQESASVSLSVQASVCDEAIDLHG